MFLTKIYTTKTITHAFLLILIFLAGFYVELSQSNEEPENKSQKYADYNYETPNEMVSGQMYELATETKNPLRLALKELEPNINDMNNTITSFGNIMIKIMDVMRWDKVYLKYIKPYSLKNSTLL
jgi:archaellum component FlaF (FlaF/FlaG flagellin family)